MTFRSISSLSVLVVLLISGCAVSPPPETVPPGKTFGGSDLQVAAPNAQGWSLVRSSPATLAFGHAGASEHSSYIASVSMFSLPTVLSAEDFEKLVIQQASSDMDNDRFVTMDFTHHYTAARGYPCVATHNVSQDRKAQTGSGKTSALLLENYHLYCKHPVREGAGFDIAYSYRASERDPQLHSEAEAFFAGVRVPDAASAR